MQWHPSSTMCVKEGPEQLNPLSHHSLLCTIGKQCLSSTLYIPAPTDKWIFCAPGIKCSWRHQRSLNGFTFRQSHHKKTHGQWFQFIFLFSYRLFADDDDDEVNGEQNKSALWAWGWLVCCGRLISHPHVSLFRRTKKKIPRSILNCIFLLLLCFAECNEAYQLLVWAGALRRCPCLQVGANFMRSGKLEWDLKGRENSSKYPKKSFYKVRLQYRHLLGAIRCLDNRFFLSTLLVNSNQGSLQGSSPSLLCRVGFSSTGLTQFQITMDESVANNAKHAICWGIGSNPICSGSKWRNHCL